MMCQNLLPFDARIDPRVISQDDPRVISDLEKPRHDSSGVKTCDVAITVTNIDTGKIVDGAHSAECSLDDGYYE
jgi:hypothetical protein